MKAMNNETTDGLPNFLFLRDEDMEKSHGFVLAGSLLTDIPIPTGEPEYEDGALIDIVILKNKDSIGQATQAAVWRPDVIKSAAPDDVYPDDVLRARAGRCLTVAVRMTPRKLDALRREFAQWLYLSGVEN
jgi:hypothetical protein